MANQTATFNELTVTFSPKFSEFITLYRGVERVWISGAPFVPEQDRDKDGILFAEMQDGAIQTLGPVSAYYYAQKNGYTGTFEQWVQLLLDSSDNATSAANSAAAALASKNSASASEANAHTSEVNAASSAFSATTSATNAHTSETNAFTSASNAFASESNAHSSEAAAAASETSAATSASNASSSAIAAAASESNALTSANNAHTSETNAHNSELAASQSESNAAISETNASASEIAAQTAQSAAETAQQKAEEAMAHYPRIKNNDNWEIWDVTNEQWLDTGHKSIAEATVAYAYQNSINGTTPPSDPSAWTINPDPQTGKYMWTRITYTWTNGSVDIYYNVSYIGANGNGSVNSVNGLGGDVILDGTNIYVDNSVQNKETMYQAFNRIGVAITNSEIDALFV